MELKNITQVEEVEALSGGEKVFVSKDGTIKQIAPENARFGGGTVTTFVLAQVGSQSGVIKQESSPQYTLYKDMDGTPVTAQEVYDALTSGVVWLLNYSYGVMVTPLAWKAEDSSGKIVTPLGAASWSGLASSTPEYGGAPNDVARVRIYSDKMEINIYGDPS